jgi:hypothetical protein
LSQEDELVDGLAISEFKGVVVRGVLLVRLDGGHNADGRIIRKVDVPEGHGLDGGHRPQQQLQRTARHLHGGGLEADCAQLPVRGTLFNFALLYNFYDVMFLLYHRGAHLYYGRARGEVGALLAKRESGATPVCVTCTSSQKHLGQSAPDARRWRQQRARHVKGKETLLPRGWLILVSSPAAAISFVSRSVKISVVK